MGEDGGASGPRGLHGYAGEQPGGGHGHLSALLHSPRLWGRVVDANEEERYILLLLS